MIIVSRILFLVLSFAAGFFSFFDHSLTYACIAGGAAFAVSFILLVLIEYFSHTVSIKQAASSIVGLLIGLAGGMIISVSFSFLTLPLSASTMSLMRFFIVYAAAFATMLFFMINFEEFGFLNQLVPGKTEGPEGGIYYKILDTSVIIDGRISDICDTGFLEGILVIPNFVLNELQMIADSADSIKRNRGRRGLDILNKMQKDQGVKVKISDMDFPEIPEVDAKLVKLAKVMKAKVVTNDFNLNKVAEFHGVPVLNINQLSNALKPIVLPGEDMKISLVKEGKDASQAIGYLDDGTMVVVENGRRRLNHDVDVVVTSVLQTTAGRMIFGRLKDGN
jgi:uncharacterized protein YacL